MNTKSRPDALLAKNASDFDAKTQAIESALKKIEKDLRLKPTQVTLAKLSDCTRGTLNNRGWPIVKLEAIKNARNKHSDSPPRPEAEEIKPESEINKLKRQLLLNRTENARLHDRNEALRKELEQAKDLLASVTRLAQNTRQDISPPQPQSRTGKVVLLREKAMGVAGQESGSSKTSS